MFDYLTRKRPEDLKKINIGQSGWPRKKSNFEFFTTVTY